MKSHSHIDYQLLGKKAPLHRALATMKTERELSEAEQAELDAIAKKYLAGTATAEDMRRAYLLQGYDQAWAAWLAENGSIDE